MIRIGTDIVSIDRIDRSHRRFGRKFFKRYLNETEYSSKSRIETLAGYWAAKEAVAKALGCGIGTELSFHDIFIRKDEKGAPSFQLSAKASKRFPLRDSSLSISHDGGFAIAVAVVVIEE